MHGGGVRELARAWPCLISTSDAYGDDGHVELFRQYGKGLFELRHIASASTCALGEDGERLAVLQYASHLENGVLEVSPLHYDDIVTVCHGAAHLAADMLFGGVEIVATLLLLAQTRDYDWRVHEALMVGCEYVGA